MSPARRALLHWPCAVWRSRDGRRRHATNASLLESADLHSGRGSSVHRSSQRLRPGRTLEAGGATHECKQADPMLRRRRHHADRPSRAPRHRLGVTRRVPGRSVEARSADLPAGSTASRPAPVRRRSGCDTARRVLLKFARRRRRARTTCCARHQAAMGSARQDGRGGGDRR